MGVSIEKFSIQPDKQNNSPTRNGIVYSPESFVYGSASEYVGYEKRAATLQILV